MKRLLIFLFFAGTAGAQVEMQANPVTMRSFRRLTGLPVNEVGLWNVTVRNSTPQTVKVSLADIQLAFPEVSFLDSFEAGLLLNRKQAASIWKVLYALMKDATLGATAFVSPWFLTAKPVLDQLESQIQARVPDQGALVAKLMVQQITLAPGDTAMVPVLSGLMDRKDVHSYKAQMPLPPKRAQAWNVDHADGRITQAARCAVAWITTRELCLLQAPARGRGSAGRERKPRALIEFKGEYGYEDTGLKTQIGNEGENANETGAVLNPASLII